MFFLQKERKGLRGGANSFAQGGSMREALMFFTEPTDLVSVVNGILWLDHASPPPY